MPYSTEIRLFRVARNVAKGFPARLLDLQPDGSVLMESYFFSPFGTSEYLCTKCGFRAMNEATAYRIRDMWMDPSNFSLYVKRGKAFVKLANKLGKL